jgi:hypothetical protein
LLVAWAAVAVAGERVRSTTGREREARILLVAASVELSPVIPELVAAAAAELEHSIAPGGQSAR